MAHAEYVSPENQLRSICTGNGRLNSLRYRLLRWPALFMALLFSVSFATPPILNNGKLLNLMQTRYGNEGAATFTAWKTLIQKNQRATKVTQLEAVNNFFNHHIQFQEDIDVWQKNDYWATPLETLGRNAGDGKDFSLAKYMTLLMMGVPANQLRLTYVKAKINQVNTQTFRTHMVLAFYPELNATPIILDNIKPQLLNADQRSDLQPIFSVNTDELHARKDPKFYKNSTAQLSPWRDLLTRMHQDGLH